jgi:hypothetical protein
LIPRYNSSRATASWRPVLHKGAPHGARHGPSQEHRRTGVYLFRRRVPRRLQAVVGKIEEVRSLGTKDLTVARARFAAAAAEVEERWKNLARPGGADPRAGPSARRRALPRGGRGPPGRSGRLAGLGGRVRRPPPRGGPQAGGRAASRTGTGSRPAGRCPRPWPATITARASMPCSPGAGCWSPRRIASASSSPRSTP